MSGLVLVCSDIDWRHSSLSSGELVARVRLVRSCACVRLVRGEVRTREKILSLMLWLITRNSVITPADTGADSETEQGRVW